MHQRLVAISGRCPDYRPKVSRALKEGESFPSEGDLFHVEELGGTMLISDVNDDNACFFLRTDLVEGLRDTHGWREDEAALQVA